MFKKSQGRFMTLDLLRGLSILLMMVFHLCFDLNHFHFITIDIYTDEFWRYFRWTILTMFIFSSGYTLSLVHRSQPNWHKALNRSVQLIILSVIISAATYFLFPKTWIYFGVLHFFALASLLALPLVRYPKTALVLAFVIGWGYFQHYLGVNFVYVWLQPLLDLPKRTEDLVPILPWIIPMLVGVFAGRYKLLPTLKTRKVYRGLLFMGRHPLMVYMLHQPIIFGTLMLIKSL